MHRVGLLLRFGAMGAVAMAAVILLVLAGPGWAFFDVPAGHAYENAVDELSQRGIIGGYVNGSFGLNDPVKRAQFAKMIVGALGIAPNASTGTRFTDLGPPDANGYPHRFVQTAYDRGITRGTDAAQTLFATWNSIRRDQVVTMIVRGADSLRPGALLDPPSGAASLFDGVAEPHGQNLRVAEYNGLLDGLIGMGPGWSAVATATRGEVAQMLWNLLVVLDGDGSPPSTTPPTTTPPTTTPPPSQARDVWVKADGTGDFPTLEAAVTALGPGSTIHLGVGTFALTKTLTVDFSLKVMGAGWQTGKTLVTCPDTVVAMTGARFVAENVRFVSTSTGKSSNVLKADDADVELRSCYFSGGNRLNEDGGSGLFLTGTTVATVKDCVFTKNALHGISLAGSADALLETNTCTSNGGAGILFSGDSRGTARNNYGGYNATRGITAQSRAAVVLEENTCEYNTLTGISLLNNATGTIRDNDCSHNGRHGISVSDQAVANVEDNTCVGNADTGIIFFDQSRGTVRRNECTGNKYGIYIYATADPTIENNNTLSGNTVYPQLYDERLM